jgi:3-dehydroquinate synthetase
MGGDKKVQNGRLRLILPTAIGQAVIHALPDTALLEEIIAGS